MNIQAQVTYVQMTRTTLMFRSLTETICMFYTQWMHKNMIWPIAAECQPNQGFTCFFENHERAYDEQHKGMYDCMTNKMGSKLIQKPASIASEATMKWV